MELTSYFEEYGSPVALREQLVMGVGNFGVYALEKIHVQYGPIVQMIGVHTHTGLLDAAEIPRKLQLGAGVCNGEGTLGDPVLGADIVKAEEHVLREAVSGCRVLHMLLGLGGGTGGGCGPAIAEAAQHEGVRVLVWAVMPFGFEGEDKRSQADVSLKRLREKADAVITVSNDLLISTDDETTGAADMFERANLTFSQLLVQLAHQFSSMNLLRMDTSDLQKFAAMQDGCSAISLTELPVNDIEAGIVPALEQPLLNIGFPKAAEGLILMLLGSQSLTWACVDKAVRAIRTAYPQAAQFLLGVGCDQRSDETVTVCLIEGMRSSEAETMEAPAVSDEDTEPQTAEPPPVKASAAGSKKKKKPVQTHLSLSNAERGRFTDVEPTVQDGEDLDIPAYIRRGVKLSQMP